MKSKLFNNLPILYQNKRVLVVDASPDPKFGMDYQLVIWDKYCNFEAGWANQLADGSYKGFCIYGPHSLEFDGKDIVELAVNCLALHKWIMSH